MRRAAGIILLVCALAGLSHETRALDLSMMTDAQLGRAFRESMLDEGFFGGLKTKLGSLFSGAKKVANTLGISPDKVVEKVTAAKDVLCGEKIANLVASAQSGNSVIANFVKKQYSNIQNIATAGCQRAFSSVGNLVVQQNPKLENTIENAVVCAQISGENMCADAVGCKWYADNEVGTLTEGCYRVPCNQRAAESAYDNHEKADRMKEFCEKPVYQNMFEDAKDTGTIGAGGMTPVQAATVNEGRPLVCEYDAATNACK